MNPHIWIENTEKGLEKASELLKKGKLVAFPTETVYGLGANALNADAVQSIFTAKGRPLTDPLIVHVHNKDSALELLDLMPSERDIFNALSEDCWPGPLTIIAKAKDIIPMMVTANTGFVGIRIPSHPLALKLLETSKLPIAAPSANRFGHVSPTLASHVFDDLGSTGIYILSGDDEIYSKFTCLHGIESSVVKLNGIEEKLLILRQGAITQERLQNILSKTQISWSVHSIERCANLHDDTSSKIIGEVAPGQALTHYASDIPSVIIEQILSNIGDCHQEKKILQYNFDDLKHIVVIDYNCQLLCLKDSVLAYQDLSSNGSSIEAAHNLFESLRWTETFSNCTQVFLPSIIIGSSIDENDIIRGLSDRIFRAASGKKTYLLITNNL